MTRPEEQRDTRTGPLSGPLGRRLLAGFLGLSLLPLLVSNGLGYMRSEVIIEGLVERYLTGIAELQARHISERLAALEAVLADLSRRWATDAGRVGRNSLWNGLDLEDALAENPGLEALYVFDEHGEVFASAPLMPTDLSLWIGPPLSAPTEVFEVRRDTSAVRYPFVRVAQPIEGGGERGQLYIGAMVSVGASLLELPEHTAGSVETIVVDEVGRPVFVSHPHGHVDYGVRLDNPLLSPNSPGSALYSDRLGLPVLGIVIDIPSYPWRLINEVPVDDALQELRGLREVSLWLATILALVVVSAAWLLAGRIVAPVRRLVAATRRLGSGELSARVVAGDGDEIGELSASFNRMAADLEQTSARVEELHRGELERAAQLATAGELAAGVAHEIKNPIAGISGGMDLLAKRVPDDPELRRIIEEMRRQTSRVGVAVRDLLTFARPVEPRLAPTDVNLVVERAETLTVAAAEAAGVTIQEELAPGLPSVDADAELLGQCLVNLLINAIQAAGMGGVVVLRTALGSGGVLIGVTDSGEGIPPDGYDQIFKPFFTTKHQGTGLGLSITADIVARHGGRISVESEPGDGATFSIWLPVERPVADPEGE